MKFTTPHLRLPSNNKPYHLHNLQEFAACFNSKEIASVSFGKQDTRGGYSISLFTHRHCITGQRFFESKDALLGFVAGFVAARLPNQRKLTRIPF